MATGQRLFTDAFRDMQRAVETFRSGSYPPSDVIDHAEYFTLEAELPGYTKKNIKFEVVDTRTLILSGSLNDDEYEAHHQSDSSRTQEVEKSRQRKAQYLIRERNPAESFSRQYNFHTHIKSEGIKARFQDGILKAIVPKVNIEKHQQINID
ncbi:HSP20-like chaperone [Mucor mucedo]|uniref:HSP20-like chaperone n=1 Tax=Mucor mucedo TaxID=29922 RepID=UPI0022201426|nr:HSP20-like chaperone [Mucor mucedo]KAI7893587.1 HSP20-like chaperone [Mucor mucedo]